ncbi:MAG: Na/Pi cotransporter family protein [Bdellovibrionaceae bacterium]|nr:Na/Pi cotransporter family protein [Bdellovibrionales bacterium]MCB9084372.1 Na/Pi cotransporter family protein [Pseudobdellovibrionaceae bacterium]
MTGQHSSFVITLGGISLFMLGMTLASDNLQKLAANRIRDLLVTLSRKPIFGLLVGILMTLVIQSSGAVISMLVGLGSAGVFSLTQVMGVILGVTIGTTFTVQLLSLNVAQFGLPIFAIAFMFYFMARKRVFKQIMAVIMGFGLIFWGLDLIGVGTNALRDVGMFANFLSQLKANPFYTIVITAIFTALVHSSAVTIGFAMTLAMSGQIDLVDSVYWVYGANIGTTATPLMAAVGGNHVGRQVAWAHCIYKIVSVLIFMPLTPYLADLVSSTNIQRDVANVHTAFNVAASALFFPFINYGAKLIEKIFPPKDQEKEFSVKYLERGSHQSPSVVAAHAEREVLRMADIVLSMVRDSIEILKDENPDLEESIKERDDRVDLLNREINLFLARHMEEADPTNQRRMMRIIYFGADLESAADVIDNNILDLARKKHALKLGFSKEGREDLMVLHREVLKVAEMSVSCFQVSDMELGSKVIFHKREVRKLEKQLRESHIERLVKGKAETINTSSIHLDVLSDYRRVVGLMSNHVYGLLKENDPYNILPRR